MIRAKEKQIDVVSKGNLIGGASIVDGRDVERCWATIAS
jgi:hypothetical protein